MLIRGGSATLVTIWMLGMMLSVGGTLGLLWLGVKVVKAAWGG